MKFSTGDVILREEEMFTETWIIYHVHYDYFDFIYESFHKTRKTRDTWDFHFNLKQIENFTLRKLK